MRKLELKKIAVWFAICLSVFILSTFLHECGHGLANKINGVSVSTGFNRVGNAFKYPYDLDFRTGFNATQTFLMDFGVPFTLVCAVLFSILLYVNKNLNKYVAQVIAAFALCNSIIRLVPCLFSVLLPMSTGKIHIEDEIQTGQLLVKIYGVAWLIAVPAILSIGISLVCYIIVNRRKREIQSLMFTGMVPSLWVAYVVSSMMENCLDNILRINWIA